MSESTPLVVAPVVVAPVADTPSARAPAAPNPGPDPAVQVLRQFRVVFNAVRTHFQQMEKQTGVGGAQVWALSEIGRHPGLGMNGLARAMDIHQSTASNLVRQLVKRGLVRTEKATTDRRNVHLTLEPAAHAVLQAVPGPHQGLLPEVLRQLPPETLQQLSLGMAQLIGALSVGEAGAGIPLADL